MKHIICGAMVLGLSACAQLHHAQLGDIDNRSDATERAFEIKVSETGVSTYEAGQIARALTQSAVARSQMSDGIVWLEAFQLGPRTGNPVWDATYAENLIDLLHKECPRGDISDLMAVRETRKYPAISGEIVKITGVCREAKGSAT